MPHVGIGESDRMRQPGGVADRQREPKSASRTSTGMALADLVVTGLIYWPGWLATRGDGICMVGMAASMAG